MKFLSAFMLGCLPLVLANSILVTFPKDTPDSVVEDARQAIIDSDGKITHDFQLIKGFAAEAPKEAIQQMSVKSAAYNPTIEDDSTMSIQQEV